MATITTPTVNVSKQQVVTYITFLFNAGVAAVVAFDPSVHIPASAKGYVATGAVAVAGVVAGWFNHSSHKVEIAKVEAETKKILAGVSTVEKVASLPPTIPAS